MSLVPKGPNYVHKQDKFDVERYSDAHAKCIWTISDIKNKAKKKSIWSDFFDVGGYDCRLLVYPGGASFTWLPWWQGCGPS